MAIKKRRDLVEQNWLAIESWKHLLIPILDPSSMEQYATAETWKNCNLRSKHYVWDDMNCLNKNS